MRHSVIKKICTLCITAACAFSPMIPVMSSAATSTVITAEVQKSLDNFFVAFEKKLRTYQPAQAIAVAKNVETKINTLVNTKFANNSDVKELATALVSGIHRIRDKISAEQSGDVGMTLESLISVINASVDSTGSSSSTSSASTSSSTSASSTSSSTSSSSTSSSAASTSKPAVIQPAGSPICDQFPAGVYNSSIMSYDQALACNPEIKKLVDSATWKGSGVSCQEATVGDVTIPAGSFTSSPSEYSKKIQGGTAYYRINASCWGGLWDYKANTGDTPSYVKCDTGYHEVTISTGARSCTKDDGATITVPSNLQGSSATSNAEFQKTALATLKSDWQSAINGGVVPKEGDSMPWVDGTLVRMRYGNDGGIKLIYKVTGGSWYVCNEYYDDPVKFAGAVGGGVKAAWAEQYGADMAYSAGGQLAGGWTNIIMGAIQANWKKRPYAFSIGGNGGVTAVVHGDDANLNTPLNEVDANKNVYVTYNGKTVTANEFLKTNWYRSIVGSGN